MSYTTPSIAKNKIQRSLIQIIHGYPKEKDKQKIWQYFNNRCAYCDCLIEIGSRKGHLDHLVAVSDGGTNDIHNFVLACSTCNGDEKREQDWLDFLKLKCENFPKAIFDERFEKITSWQNKAELLKIDNETQLEIDKIIAQAKQDFDNAVIKMRALKKQIIDKEIL